MEKYSSTSRYQVLGVRILWCRVVKINIKAYQIVLSRAHNEVRLAWSDGGFDFE
jgi:hypothetical protein